MKRRWFAAWGRIYRPVSWQGIIVTLIGLAFSVQVFLAVDGRSHSVSDTLYGIFPFIVPCWMLVYWVASKTAHP
jgi:urea transporter